MPPQSLRHPLWRSVAPTGYGVTVSSRATRRAARARAAVPPDPPLVTLHDALRATDEHVESFISRWEGDAADNFTRWRSEPERWSTLSSRQIGNAEDLAFVYLNVNNAEEFITRIARRVQERGGTPSVRADAAGRNVLAATYVLHGALLGHLREHEIYEYGTCSLARTGIELAARAAMIARGAGNEASLFNRGDAIRAADAMRVFDGVVTARRADADQPSRVYAWLCHFTHMDAIAMRGVSHEQAYAALSYVCWATAVAAEVVVGEPFAMSPTRWPSPRPWE